MSSCLGLSCRHVRRIVQPRTRGLPMKLIVLFVLLALSGCVSSGNPTIRDEAVTAQIKIGATTKEEVRELLGKPNSIGKGSGNLLVGVGLPITPQINYEIWNYTHINVETNPAAFIPIIGLFFMGATASSSSVTIHFDENGIVRYLHTAEFQSTSGIGTGSQKPTGPPQRSK